MKRLLILAVMVAALALGLALPALADSPLSRFCTEHQGVMEGGSGNNALCVVPSGTTTGGLEYTRNSFGHLVAYRVYNEYEWSKGEVVLHGHRSVVERCWEEWADSPELDPTSPECQL